MKLSHNKHTSRIRANVKPLPGKVLVRDLQFGDFKTKGGIYVMSDDGTERGIHPRWAQVWKVAEDIKDISEGEWVLVEHGRWSRTFMVENDTEQFNVNQIDYPNGVLLVSEDKPSDENLRFTGYSR